MMPTADRKYIDHEIMEQLQMPHIGIFFYYIAHAKKPRGRYINWTIEARPYGNLPDTLYEELKFHFPFKAQKSARDGHWLFSWNGVRRVSDN